MKAILFDLDGTLIESSTAWTIAMRDALTSHGLTFNETINATIAQKSLKTHLETENLTDDQKKSIVRHARETVRTLVPAEITWIPGVQKAIEAISLPKGIVTNAHRPYLLEVDRHLDLSRYFKTIVCVDDVGNRGKPDPSSLLLACTNLEIEPKDCLYIGDQAFDIEAAQNAGMPSCFIRSTHSPSILSIQPTYECSSMDDVCTLLVH